MNYGCNTDPSDHDSDVSSGDPAAWNQYTAVWYCNVYRSLYWICNAAIWYLPVYRNVCIGSIHAEAGKSNFTIYYIHAGGIVVNYIYTTTYTMDCKIRGESHGRCIGNV